MSAVMKCNAHLIWHGFIGFSLHEALPPPYMATIPFSPAISFHTLFGTRLGALPSWSVRGIGNIPMLGRGNDSGLIVPHIHLNPQLDPLNLLTIIFGSSEVFMGASAVRIPVDDMMSKLPGAVGDFMGDEEQAIGTCLFPGPVSLNVGCSSPFLIPGDFVVAPNTVQVGISLADILFAVFMYVLSAIIDGLMQGFTSGKWTPDSAITDTGEKLGKRAAREFIIEKGFAKRIVKQAVKDSLEEEAAGLIVDAVMEGWGEEALEGAAEWMAGGNGQAAGGPAASRPASGAGPGGTSSGGSGSSGATGATLPAPGAGAAETGPPLKGGPGTHPADPSGSAAPEVPTPAGPPAGRPELAGTGAGTDPVPNLPSVDLPSMPGAELPDVDGLRTAARSRAQGLEAGLGHGDHLSAVGRQAGGQGAQAPGGFDPEALRKARLDRLNALGEDMPIEKVEETAKRFLSGVFGAPVVERQWADLRGVVAHMVGHGRALGGVPGIQSDQEGEDFWEGAWTPQVCE